MSELAPEVANVLASDGMLVLLDLCKAGRLFEEPDDGSKPASKDEHKSIHGLIG